MKRKVLMTVGGLAATEAVVWAGFQLSRLWRQRPTPWEVEAASLFVVSSCLGTCGDVPRCRNCMEGCDLMRRERELTTASALHTWALLEGWMQETWRREALSSAVD